MSETADRYRERAVAFTEKVEGVPDDRWEAQSPCEDWTARDVVRHMVSVSGMFLGFVGQDPPPAPSVDDDPKTAWSVTRDALQAALEDPKVAQQEYDGMFGKTTFEKSVGQFVCADLVVHNWDLSRATGQDDSLDPQWVKELHTQLEPMDAQMRGPNAFGPKVEPPAGADDQTRLLCFLGRQP